MSENRRQIEAILFKPVSGGFIYRAPNPWIFGRANHYIVDEQQKAELLGMLVARRPLLRLAVIAAGVVAWGVAMGTVGWLMSDHENPTIGDAVIMILMTIAALFLALHLALRRQLRRVQPILAAATPTTAAITSSEIRAAISKTTSFKAAMFSATMCAFGCACQIFILVIRNARHPLFSDVQSGLSIFIAAVCAAAAIGYFVRAIGKARQTQTAA
jgi:membrane-associated HD superfamily phosphohydrolase